MQKCLNCKEPAHYTVKNPGASTQYFCISHLPNFINANKLPDHVTRFTPEVPEVTNVVATPVEEVAPAKTKKKSTAKSEPVVETPAVEEVVVEEVLTEAPTEE